VRMSIPGVSTPGMETLAQADPDLWDAMVAERRRQRDNIELIASENYVSAAVLEAQGSWLTNKYAEGLPGKRYYGGCEYVDVAERLAQERRDIERRYDAQDAECHQRFAVTSCVDEVRRARREALDEVTARQIALDDAERQRRAQARRERIERRTARHAAEARDHGASSAGGAASAPAP